jgi:hypothetical protein
LGLLASISNPLCNMVVTWTDADVRIRTHMWTLVPGAYVTSRDYSVCMKTCTCKSRLGNSSYVQKQVMFPRTPVLSAQTWWDLYGRTKVGGTVRFYFIFYLISFETF